MSGPDFTVLLPLIILAATILALALLVAIHRHHGAAVGLSIAGLAAVCASLPTASSAAPRVVTSLIVVDAFGLFYLGLIALATMAVVGMAFGYLRGREDDPEEFYLLLLLGAFGASVMVISRHLATLFLGLETLSVALYPLVAYRRRDRHSVEAGIKYLLLAAATAAFLILGMALVYTGAGSLVVEQIGNVLRMETAVGQPWLAMGVALILVGIGFKLAAFPFHLWTPDVYQGAPAPATAFIASVSKGATLGLLIRYFLLLRAYDLGQLTDVIVFLAGASMFAGNLLALLQTSVKRILAYSSIAHMGYMLVAFLGAGATGAEAVTFYLVTYFATILSAFGVVTVLSDREHDRDRLEDYRGLLWRRPALGTLFAISLFSLAGIPLTAGFFGKYFAVASAVSVQRWSLVIILAVNSAMSAFYYLRIVVTMASPARGDEPAYAPVPLPAVPVLAGATLAGLAGVLLWLGVAPSPIVDLIAPAAAALAP